MLSGHIPLCKIKRITENIHEKCDAIKCDKIVIIITNTSIKKACERKAKTAEKAIKKNKVIHTSHIEYTLPFSSCISHTFFLH